MTSQPVSNIDHALSTPAPAYFRITQRDTDCSPPNIIPINHLELAGSISNTVSSNRVLCAHCSPISPPILSIFHHAVRFPICCYLFVTQIHDLIPQYYSCRFGYNSCHAENTAERGNAEGIHAQWKKKVAAINSDYVIISTGSSGIFGVVVTILQLQSTSTNAFFTTFVIAAIALILEGVCCAVVYIGYKSRIASPAIANQWRDAVHHDAPLWRLLALPLSFILWAGGFTCAAMILLAWSNLGGSSPPSGDSSATAPPDLVDRLSLPLRGTTITLIVIFGAWKIYSARKQLCSMARQ